VGGVVYAAESSSRLIAVNQGSGERVWQREFGSMVTPVVAGNALFIVTAQNELLALNIANGKVFWVQPLTRFEDAKDREGVVLWSAPVLAGGKLWLAGTHGKMVAADPVSGKILATQTIHGGVQIAPIVAASTMYVLSENGVLAAYTAK
jgi:outer membrane protein assembly factor BamB